MNVFQPNERKKLRHKSRSVSEESRSSSHSCSSSTVPSLISSQSEYHSTTLTTSLSVVLDKDINIANSTFFVAIQIEISNTIFPLRNMAQLSDIQFNRCKSVEDLFMSRTLVEEDTDSCDHTSNNNHRGGRCFRSITIESYTPNLENELVNIRDRRYSAAATPSPVHNVLCINESEDKTKDDSIAPRGEAAIKFISGNPFVEVTQGILHLHKENESTSLEEGVIRSPMLCMLSVPSKLKSADLIQFTASSHTQLEVMRVVQDSSLPNHYMVLLRFSSQESADQFFNTFNGQPYNSFDVDVCSLAYVSKIEMCKESQLQPLANHTELPVCTICLERMDESISLVLTVLCNHSFHGSCLAQWEDSTCPVCRHVQTPDVVDEQKCSESDCQSAHDLWICLICGYIGCGRYLGGHAYAHFKATAHCYTMELGQNRVWDYVGDNFVHRLLHTHSTDGKNGKIVETTLPQEFNDLSLDGDVERRVRSSSDREDTVVVGRRHCSHCIMIEERLQDEQCGEEFHQNLVDDENRVETFCNHCSDTNEKLLSSDYESGAERRKLCSQTFEKSEKFDSIQLEFTYLLTSQLDTQKRYFEKIINQMEDSWESMSEQLKRQNESNEQQIVALQKSVDDLQREKSKMESKSNQMKFKMRESLQNLQDERELNKCLTSNQSKYQEQIETLKTILEERTKKSDDTIKDLKEQLRDVMFFVEAQNTISKSEMRNEIQGGDISTLESNNPTQSSSSHSRNSSHNKKHRKSTNG